MPREFEEYLMSRTPVTANPTTTTTTTPAPIKHTVKQALEHRRRVWGFDRLKQQEHFLNSGGTSFVVLPGRDGAAESVEVRSDRTQGWLMCRYAEEHNSADTLTEWDCRTILPWFHAYVTEQGVIRDESIRVAADTAGTVWLDLGKRAIHITPGTWEVVDGSAVPLEVRFRRPAGYLPIDPAPVHGGDLNDLRRFLNCGTGPEGEMRWRTMVGWLLGTLLPWGHYAVLVLNGAPNSGKSTVASFLRMLVDPNAAPTNQYPRKEQHIIVNATNCRTTVYDNISHLSQAASDIFCQIATGMGVTERKYYTNNDPVIYVAHGPTILTGVPNFVRSSDLVTRSLRVVLPPFPDSNQQQAGGVQLEEAFMAARPRLLGALLDVFAAGLARLPEVQATAAERPNDRMGDLRDLVLACEPALGWESGTWEQLTQHARKAAHARTLEESPVMDALLTFITNQPQNRWEGSTLDLYTTLSDFARAHHYNVSDRSWPATPAALGKHLSQTVKPSLDAVGITVEDYIDGPKEHRRRCVRITDTRGGTAEAAAAA